MKPPKQLSAEAKRIWRDTIESATLDHFRAADATVLENFAEAVADLRLLRKQWRAEGCPTTMTHANGAEGRHPLLTAVQSQSAAVTSLAKALRLCPSARISPQRAGSARELPDEGKFAGLLG